MSTMQGDRGVQQGTTLIDQMETMRLEVLGIEEDTVTIVALDVDGNPVGGTEQAFSRDEMVDALEHGICFPAEMA